MPRFKYQIENADNAPLETWQELPDQQEAIKSRTKRAGRIQLDKSCPTSVSRGEHLPGRRKLAWDDEIQIRD